MNHFDVAYLGIAPFFLGAAYYKRLRHGKYRKSLPGMFGANLPVPALPDHRERAWLHSVSVGETVAAGALYKLLRRDFPQWQVLSTTTTETGQEQARRSLPDANGYDFAPADLSWNVRRFLNAWNPSVYLFFETEIWPNILLECGRRRMPVFMINGKLSERSARGYARLGSLLRRPLASVSTFYMQTEDDARRLRGIVGDQARILVTGNVKFDNLPEPLSSDERAALRSKWGIDATAPLVVAGSTHPREEKILIEALGQLRQQHPTARLVLAPRHPERFDAVAEEIRSLGSGVVRTSRGERSQTGNEVVLLDEMGVLGRAFGAGDVAIVGGAWNPIGGHNLLEPAAHGIPVVHGPHMHAQKEIMRIMNSHGASVGCEAEALGGVLSRLVADPAERALLGEKGRRAAQENRGAARRVIDDLARQFPAR